VAGRKTDSGYKVLVGINYGPDDKRAEPGDVVSDIPNKSITWMVEQGIIEPVGKPPAAPEIAAEPPSDPDKDASKAGE